MAMPYGPWRNSSSADRPDEPVPLGNGARNEMVSLTSPTVTSTLEVVPTGAFDR
jgi:hypothetical protein